MKKWVWRILTLVIAVLLILSFPMRDIWGHATLAYTIRFIGVSLLIIRSVITIIKKTK